MSEQTQTLIGGKTVSEKYTYYEVGECDTWHIWDNEVRVLKDDSFFALCNTVEEAELVCRLLNEDKKRKSAPRIDRDLNKRIKLLEKVIDAKDEILVAYRLGKKPSDKALDLLQKFKESNNGK